MFGMCTATLLWLFAQQPVDSDAVIKDFNERWKAASRDPKQGEDKKISLLVFLGNHQDEKVLDVLIEKLNDKSPNVRARAADIIGNYSERVVSRKALEDAAGVLARALDNDYNEKQLQTMASLLRALASLKQAGRPEVQRVNVFLRQKYDTEIIKGAVNAVGTIRHRSSIEPLIDLIQALHSEINSYFDKNRVKPPADFSEGG